MEPRIATREKKILLSNEVSYRIHCSSIYPIPAPNGSTIVLYGHDRGLRVLWRGGRRPRERPSTSKRHHTNGVSNSEDVIVIDDDEDEDESQQVQKEDDPGEDYESEEDEEDPDCPFPAVLQDVDIGLQTEVLRMALPCLPPSASHQRPALTKTHMILALACSDGKVFTLTIPLAPPTSAVKEEFVANEISEIQLDTNGSIPSDIAIKILPSTSGRSSGDRMQEDAEAGGSDHQVLLAVATKSVNIWRFSLGQNSLTQSSKHTTPLINLPSSASHLSFHPTSTSSELLLVDQVGAVRIFDAFATSIRPSSHDSTSPSSASSGQKGRWVMSYQAPFQSHKDWPALARRKRILAAEWVLGGRALLTLLDDGEWGIWDMVGSPPAAKSVEDFALRGFLDSSGAAELADASKQKKPGSKLAPMTPKTRRAKAEKLFSGASKPPGVASTGGICVTADTTRIGQIDESVIIWCNAAVYSIPNMQVFWQRSISAGSSGSLYAPGLTQISDIDLMNENITSISQFALLTPGGSFGQMKLQRDLLISAEHRFVILQNLRSQGVSGGLFQRQLAEQPASHDQRMLDTGDLDVGGMHRMLDSMGGNTLGTRRVGFVP